MGTHRSAHGMMEGHSYSVPPLVLEYEDIIYVIDRSELAISVCPYCNKVCDVVNIEVCKCGVMFVCVEDYFANACAGWTLRTPVPSTAGSGGTCRKEGNLFSKTTIS